MNLLTDARVYLVGYQAFDDEEFGRFIRNDLHKNPDELPSFEREECSDSELLCETAGRICYDSYGRGRKTNEEYLKHIIESGHGSVAEHCVFSFVFTGVSRSLTHELVRHRAGMSYSQQSQRYVDESEANFVVPPHLLREVQCAQHRRLRRSSLAHADSALLYPYAAEVSVRDPDGYDLMADAGEQWLECLRVSQQGYVWLTNYLSQKIAKEQPELDKTSTRKAARGTARSVLPNATESRIFVTVNARALRGILEQRCSRHAEVEIRYLFNRVYDQALDACPHLFGDYAKEALPDGTYELTTPHRKI